MMTSVIHFNKIKKEFAREFQDFQENGIPRGERVFFRHEHIDRWCVATMNEFIGQLIMWKNSTGLDKNTLTQKRLKRRKIEIFPTSVV